MPTGIDPRAPPIYYRAPRIPRAYGDRPEAAAFVRLIPEDSPCLRG